MPIRLIIILLLVVSISNRAWCQSDHFNYDSLNLEIEKMKINRDSVAIDAVNNTLYAILNEYKNYVNPKSKTFRKYTTSIKLQYNLIREEYKQFRFKSVGCLRANMFHREIADCIRSKGDRLKYALDSLSKTIDIAASESDDERFTCTGPIDTSSYSKYYPYYEDLGNQIVNEIASISLSKDKSTITDVKRIKKAYLDKNTFLPTFELAISRKKIWNKVVE